MFHVSSLLQKIYYRIDADLSTFGHKRTAIEAFQIKKDIEDAGRASLLALYKYKSRH